jgi:hypothetical protein
MVLAPVVVMGTRSGSGSSLWQEEAEMMKKASTKTTKYNNEFFMSEFILLYQIQQ